jgi:hypothetical protein
MSRFLSKENFEYVFNISKQYLEDAKGLSVNNLQEFQRLVACEMKTIAAAPEHKNGASIDVLNKKAIVCVRNAFLAAVPTVPTAPTAPTVPADPVPEESPDERSEDAFFKKLKDLEYQRTIAANAMAAVANVKPAEEPPRNPAPIQVPPSTIILKGNHEGIAQKDVTVIVVSSMQRMWQYQTDRSTFIPTSVEFPDNADTNNMSLVKVIIPCMSTTEWLPYFKFTLEGAGNQSIDVMLVPVRMDKRWIHLEPLNARAIKPLATPWTICLKDAYGTPLEIGHDGAVVKNIIQTDRGTLALDCSDMVAGEYSEGDVVWIGGRSRTIVLKVHPSAIEIKKGSDVKINDQLVNLTRQVTCFIELPLKK